MEARLYDRPEPMRGMEHELAKSEILPTILTETLALKATALQDYAVKRSAMIGRLTWLQNHLIVIATVQPDMTEEQPLLRRLDMRNAHHLYHPVRMRPSGIVADPDVGQGAQLRGLYCEGVSTPTGEGTGGSLQGERLAFPCIASDIRLFAWGLSPAWYSILGCLHGAFPLYSIIYQVVCMGPLPLQTVAVLLAQSTARFDRT